MKRWPALAAVVAVVVLAACERVPDMVLKREPMARLIADLELAEAHSVMVSLGDSNADSARILLRQSVLARHEVNEAVLDSSLRWYGAHMARFMKVMDRADSILADSLRNLERTTNLALRVAAGDSVNIWPREPSAVFARSELSSFLTFEVEADSTWERGDVLTLSFAMDNAQSTMVTSLIADYDNRNRTTDAVIARQYPGDERRFELKLQLDKNINVKRIYGYMHLEAAEGERAFVDSIRLVRTRLIDDDYNTQRRAAVRFDRDDY